MLVSLAIFEGDGSLVAATPLEDLKNSVSPHREDWFTSAMERIENLHFPPPMSRISLSIPITATIGWSPSAARSN